MDDAALRNAAQRKGEEWLSYGFTPQETRYTPLNQINASNVSRLGLAWSFEVGPGGGGQEATPLVHNGVIFSTTQWSVVFAVDARTGKEKWRWDPEVNQTALRSKICCGVVQRGIALYDGKVIAPAIDGRLIGSGRRDRQAVVGSARLLPAGQLHHHHGPAHRQRQGDHRRVRRRSIRCAASSPPLTPRPARRPGSFIPCPARATRTLA